jgi:hypothetical protein
LIIGPSVFFSDKGVAMSLGYVSRNPLDLDKLTTRELLAIAQSNANDRQLLEITLDLLRRRKKPNAEQGAQWNADLLKQLPQPPRKRRNSFTKFAAVAIGAIAVGVGHQLGGDIWKYFWTNINSIVPVTQQVVDLER